MTEETIDKIRRKLWENKKRLDFIRRQIDEIRPMKETNGYAWWQQYCNLKDQECIAEQNIAWCEKYVK